MSGALPSGHKAAAIEEQQTDPWAVYPAGQSPLTVGPRTSPPSGQPEGNSLIYGKIFNYENLPYF